MDSSRPVARLLIAAHGTSSPTGSATIAAVAAAVAADRPDVPVSLAFLDVASPSLPDALDALDGPVVLVPLLLSAGYHVLSDIPAVVAGRPDVVVTAHIGPDPLIIDAVYERLLAARGSVPAARDSAATTVLAAIGSSEPSARAELDQAAARLAALVGRPVTVVPIAGDVRAVLAGRPQPVEVAVYLLAGGAFLDRLAAAADGLGPVAEPVGVHPALVAAVWDRFDAAERA